MSKEWREHKRTGLGTMLLLFGSLYMFILVVIAIVGSVRGVLEVRDLVPFMMVFVFTLGVMLAFAWYFMLITDMDAVSRWYKVPFEKAEPLLDQALATAGVDFRRYSAKDYMHHGANVKWRREPGWMGTATTGWSKYDLNGGEQLLVIRGRRSRTSEEVVVVIYHDMVRDDDMVDHLVSTIDAILTY